MHTVNKIAEILGTDRDIAYGLVRAFEAMGIASKTGTEEKVEGKKGKSASLYTFDVAKARVVMEEFFSKVQA